MKSKMLILLIVAIVFGLSACAKRDHSLRPAEESTVKIAKDQEEPILYLTQGAQTNDEKIPVSYTIDQAEKEILVNHVEWVETETDLGFETVQTFREHTTDLLTFNQSDSAIEFSYVDEEGTEIEKRFEILSESIVKDENEKRYEWHNLR